jgi:hypothetical protein
MATDAFDREARLEQLARELRPDVDAHSPVLNAIPAIRVGRRLGIPVVEVRAFWMRPSTTEPPRRAACAIGPRAPLKAGLSNESGMSSPFAKAAPRHCCEGIPEQKVTVIPNAVDVQGFQLSGEPDSALKRKLGLDGKTVRGSSVRSMPEGLDLLLEALPGCRPSVRICESCWSVAARRKRTSKPKPNACGLPTSCIHRSRTPCRGQSLLRSDRSSSIRAIRCV